VSEIAAPDLLTMTFDDDGQILIEAASTDALTGLSRIRRVDDSEPEEGFLLIDDLATADLFVVQPHDLRERFLTAGFRSGLVVLTRARYQRLGLSFWSQHPRAFSRENLPEARRIADHVALAVSHEQLAAAARQVAEAHARAERLEARVKSLTAGLPKGTGVSPEECREGRRVGEGTERH
jgi:GAF domain-containing protein